MEANKWIDEASEDGRFEKVAKAVSLIGIGGILAVMATGAWAQQPPAAGMPAGNKPFNNPYQQPAPAPGATEGAAGGGENFFEDEVNDDDVLYPGDAGANNGANPNPGATGGFDNGGGGFPPGGGGGARPRAAGGGAPVGGVSVGGGPPSGVIEGGDVKALAVDSHTGEGCKDIVTDFNFPDADIMDIAKTLGKLVGKNFILDNKDVKGRISIISNSPITCGDAWRAFLTALDMNGFAIIPSGKYLRIARQRDARDKQLKTYTGEFSPDTDALITRLFPLKYLSAEEVARNFRSFMPANSRIIPYEQTNTVIVTDTGSNIAKLQKLLEILDVEGYDAGIEVIPVKFASAAELSKLIDTLIPGSPAAGPPGAPRFGGGGGRGFNARRTKEGGIINTIIADERTNTLIVHANSKGADQVRELVNKLDQKMPVQAGGGKVHVIYLQFADSEQVSNTLNNISQQSSAPRLPSIGGGGGTGVNPVQQSLFEGSIKVAPDKSTNSLVVTASPADFVTVQRVVNKLDIPRDQVYAEVVIMEVTLARDFAFSSNVINPKNGVGLISSDTDLLSFATAPFAQKGAIINFQGGNPIDFKVGDKTVRVGSVFALIKAIQTNSNANILATPQILTLDNTDATFETTENIPVPVTTAVQGAGVSKSITKEPVSLSVKIKPQINKISNFVKLDIDTKLSDISKRELPAEVKDSAFATVVRSAKTSVVVGDGDTVVLGGLSRDNQQDSVSKVPILGDIPLLGWLFRSKQSSSSKTNLLIFISPKIIRQYESIRAILDKKLKERDDFLEASTGGDDPQRKYRDNMIRNLPDVKAISNAKPQTGFSIDSDGGPGGQLENNAVEAAPAPPAPPAGGQQ